jgi:hypothetical protein
MSTWTTLTKAPLKAVLPQATRRFARRLLAGPPAPAPQLYPFHKLLASKKEVIDFAVTRLGIRSFADLGGVWNVDGGYTFYALEAYGLRDGCLVDREFTPAVAKWGARYPGLRTIQGHFGSEAVAAQVGNVDAVFLFDVLLHQVNPDWDAVLALYARRVDCIVILNQQYHARKTFRLIDRGREEYFRHVPHTIDESVDYRDVFDRPDEYLPTLGCKYRDTPAIWQWGITDDDLIAVMRKLGFTLHFFKNCEPWQMPHVENHAFVFRRSVEPVY